MTQNDVIAELILAWAVIRLTSIYLAHRRAQAKAKGAGQ